MAEQKLSKGYDKYGAYMGRPNIISDENKLEQTVKLHVNKLRMSANGAYDEGGAYWGFGIPLYRAWNETNEIFIRANDREEAKEYFKSRIPNARFYR